MKPVKFEVIKSKNALSHTIGTSLERAAEFFGETIVIKISGNLLGDMVRIKEIAKNIVTMRSVGINVLVVHGGLNIVNNIIDNFDTRKNSKLTGFNRSAIESIEMVMTGYISKNIVNMINLHGGNAIGISGKDGNLIYAKKPKRFKSNSKIENIIDIGYLGEISSVNPELLFSLEDSNLIPVISPIAFSEVGDTYHVNPDQLAIEIAKIYSAIKIIYLCDHVGFKDSKNEHIKTLNLAEARSFLDSENLSDDLVSKLNCCISALEEGVEETHLISGWIENGLLIELFSDEVIGTKITNK